MFCFFFDLTDMYTICKQNFSPKIFVGKTEFIESLFVQTFLQNPGALPTGGCSGMAIRTGPQLVRDLGGMAGMVSHQS